MSRAKHQFIRLCIDENILRFGAFTLKSGRVSPYFFNAGLFNTGRLVSELGAAYARMVAEEIMAGDSGFMLYGPAYKGISLAAVTAAKLLDNHDLDVPFAFNRKEAKDHGEGGNIIGAPLQGRVIIIDDVITAGTSVGESVEIIRSAGAQPAAVAIAVDRQERAGNAGQSAVQSVENDYGMPVHAIITLKDLIDHLDDAKVQGHGPDQSHLDAVVSYRDRYGVAG